MSDKASHMNNLPMKIQLRCIANVNLTNTETTVRAGPYSLQLLPNKGATPTEAVLEFNEEIGGGGHSHPEEEGKIVLDAMSVVTGVVWTATGLRIDEVDLGIKSSQPLNVQNIERGNQDFSNQINALLRLQGDEFKQYVRSCRAYRLAIMSAVHDSALCFLLLVTAIECLSNLESFIPNAELNRSGKSAERYVRFIQRYGGLDCEDAEASESLVGNLKTVYYGHRSAFVHSGREVSVASEVADQVGDPALTHFKEDGTTVTTVGLKWYTKIVRSTLSGYLEATSQNIPISRQAIKDLASSRGIIRLAIADSKGT